MSKAWAPIIERAAGIVREYETPVTLRQVFYRLVAEGLVANKKTDYNQLSDRTAKAPARRHLPGADRPHPLHRAPAGVQRPQPTR
jgi:hypothetical protein